MKIFKTILLTAAVTVSSLGYAVKPVVPDEGMWLPLLLNGLNISEMQAMGCKLSAEQIYSVNNSSVKDAIVQLGGFCTAEVVSPQGLLLTNHHCAYDAIQSHSSVENDYLTDGFWAKTKAEELPVEGLTVSFLVRMEDVTGKIVNATKGLEGQERAEAMEVKIVELETEASEDDRYVVNVKEMFDGNAHYLFVYEVFSDIRLVGAPPSAVGKFGGDTDNWMWPRHTGDFSMLRIYAAPDNSAAEYNEANVPYEPKHYLPVSAKGLQEGDFTMIMGYPGSTDRYLSSYEVKQLMEQDAPTIIKVLRKRLDVMKEAMDAKDEVRIALASDYASLANSWKYYEGQLVGLKKFDLVDQKIEEEKTFMQWVADDAKRKKKYGKVLSNISGAIQDGKASGNAMNYLNMAGFGPTFVSNGIGYWRLMSQMKVAGEDEEKYKPYLEELEAGLDAAFEDYYAHVDVELLAATAQMMYEGIPESGHPSVFKTGAFKKAKEKGKLDEKFFAKWAKKTAKGSILFNRKKLEKFHSKPNLKVLEEDLGIEYINSLIGVYRSNMMASGNASAVIADARQLLVEGQMEMQTERNFYPDANFTLRVTYGKVKPYSSWDGKPYESFTYASQILDKYKPGDEEFDVPEKLRTLIQNKDFGSYGKDGKLPVCFIHDLDITGGNSGSPVINGDGELVGIAFDGNWESMISDLSFQEEYVRTISVDIRYVLFIIDKYADAGHLVEEMTVQK